MSSLRRFVIRLMTSVTRRQDEERLREEFEDYLALETEANVQRGLAAADARRQAVLRFGGLEAAKEGYRDEQGLPFLEHLLQDARIAIRRMKQTPAFTAAAIATLALGLGLNSAIVSLAYALFLQPLPVDGASRLVDAEQTVTGSIGRGLGFSYPDFTYYRDHARTFADLAAHYSTSPMQIVTPDGALNVSGSVASAGYFSLLRLQPTIGRFFTADEDHVPGRNPVAVLSHDLWRTHFGQDPRILGTPVRINGTAFTVIGIAPERFQGIVSGLTPNAVWIPSAMFAVGYRFCDGLARGCNVVNLIGRLAEGVSIDEAQAEMSLLARQLAATFPETNRERGVFLRPARGIRIREQLQNAPIVALLAGAAALVLLVACANVAGLLLSRGLRRRKEIAIRISLGAGRIRLIRLLLVESVALAIAGGVAGFAVAIWSTEVLRRFFGVGSGGDTVNLDLSLDPRVVLVGIASAILTGVLTGLVPALQSTRPDVLPSLKEETAGAGTRGSWLREGLIVVQVAMSVVLLACGGLLVRSFFLLQRGPGFDPSAVVLVRVRPSLVGYPIERAWAFQRDVIQRLEGLPGVAAASPGNVPPLPYWARPVQPVQLAGNPDQAAVRSSTTHVGARYFKALGANVVEGREFDERDKPEGPRVVVVNEALARQLWPRGGAVGSLVTIGRTPCEVVGVVNDRQWVSFVESPEPIAYLNFWQQSPSETWSKDSQMIVRLSGDARARLPDIRRAIAEVDPDVPVSEGDSLAARLDYAFIKVRAARTMLVTFGSLALVLSMIGLYAALTYAIGQRTREIAIRIALGAARRDVGILVLRRGATIVGLGLAGGLAAAVVAGPLLASLLYGVTPRDPIALLAGPLVLGAVALLAIWLPARRAMGMDALIALRSE